MLEIQPRVTKAQSVVKQSSFLTMSHFKFCSNYLIIKCYINTAKSRTK